MRIILKFFICIGASLLYSQSEFQTEDIPKVSGERHIVKTDTTTEERSDLVDGLAGDATTYSRDEEVEFWVLGGKLSEALYRSLHALKTFHRGNGITLSLKAFTLPPDGTEVVHGQGCSSTTMETTGITAEDEYLVRTE